MTETTTAPKAKTTKHATASFDMPDYGIPKFDLPNIEMPEAFRDMAEKGVAQARDTYAKAMVTSEEAADMLESTYEAAAKAATNYNLKLIEFAHINTRAAFDYAQELLGVNSPSEFIELSTAHMRKQFDIVSAQNKALCTLANEMVADGLISRGSP